MVKKELKEVKEPKIKKISDLPGIGPATIEKLEEFGVYSLLDLAAQTQEELNDKVGIGGASARKIIAEAKKYADMDFKTGVDIEISRESLFKISTGSENFDKLLEGGVEAGSVTEVFGEFASGKTQVAHLLAVHCIKENPKSFVVYIDSEGSFRPERIKDFSKGIGIDGAEVLKKILVVRALNSNHQIVMSEKINELIGKDKKDIKLVIVDSLTTYFRAEYIGRGKLNERQQKLNRYMHTLMKLANINNLVVLVTNQVMFRPDAMFGDPITAIGGAIVAHASKTRIYLRKGKKGSRVAKLIDSPHIADGECNFFVTESGLEDIE